MAVQSKALVAAVIAAIVLIAVGAVVLRVQLRCAGFPGPGPAADELPDRSAKASNLRVAAWNIRNFPLDERLQAPDLGFSRRTNICDLEAVLRGLDADVLGVEEICDTRRFPPILRRAGGERSYRVVFSKSGGSFGQRLGIAWDADRLELAAEPVEISEVALGRGLRPAFAAYVRSRSRGGVDFTIVQVHLVARPEAYDDRKRQYRLLADWVDRWVVAIGDDDVIVQGDFNSSGGGGGSGADELRVLDRIMAGAGLVRLPSATGCSQYWEGRGRRDGVQVASLLDHVYVRGLDELDAEVPLTAWLHCARYACAQLISRQGAEDATFWDVSDHCPLTFEIVDRDLDPP